MNDTAPETFEEQLRRFRPAPPPQGLRSRLLAGDGSVRRPPVRWERLVRIAAAAVIAAALLVHGLVERSTAPPPPTAVAPPRTETRPVELRQIELIAAWSRQAARTQVRLPDLAARRAQMEALLGS